MSQLPRVVITDFITDDLEPERRILGDLARIEALDAHGEDDLVGRIEDAAAIMLYHYVSLTRKTIDRLTRCRLIIRCGVGCDNVDREVASRRGIPVANVPDYGSEEVADTAMGMMLSLARGIARLNSRLRAARGEWSYTQAAPLARLRGRQLGIVGLGRIGTAMALRGKMLGMDVAFYDPYKPDGYDKALGIRRLESFAELLATSYVLSLHCPLTEETRHMIDGDALSQMPERSYLINTARGGIVDTAAIPAAIVSGKLAGAGIDVLACEPPGSFDPLIAAWRDPDHPAHDRVLINPHAAFYSEEGLMEMRTKGADACRRALLGEAVATVINGVHGNGDQRNGDRGNGVHWNKDATHDAIG
ncbi:MAG: C-terminal binding protein [Pirellulales bacterium]|nr:C-terminal binding protein [Pirellulales bacterium]